MKLIKFFREIKAEAKRITWAPKEQVKKSTKAVLLVAGIYVVYVGLCDYVFQSFASLLFK